MPAYWDFAWQHPSYCVDVANAPYGPLANPLVVTDSILLPNYNSTHGPVERFNCFINSPANPDFIPTEVSPQVVLDDALPATLRVSAFVPINAAASITNLRLFSTSLTNPANVTAQSVAADGSSAVFPYPRDSSGHSLPSGAYITTITTDPVGTDQTTNGMEPIYIAHDDTTYTSAFGLDVAIPTETTTTYIYQRSNVNNSCISPPTVTTNVYGGSSLPLVTLPTLGKLAVGSSTNTIAVGTNPTIVVPYNSQLQQYANGMNDPCGSYVNTTYTGAQSALVVNTGSNNVSLVNIGQYAYPTGTVVVGTQPVAAVINSAGTLAYIANYGSGTISEINLANVQLTRTLSVMSHPTALSYDSSGNLWVGGQGYLKKINISTWAVASTIPVDGTITGMSYDANQALFVNTVLQNGNATSPSNGSTQALAIAYSTSAATSYSTTLLVNPVTGTSAVSAISSNATPYAQSSLNSHLAYPGQTAFNPPIYSSSNGDLIATANGNSFTVSVLASGKVLINGTLPHPIRGVKLTTTMLYFTMAESNSLVTLPIQLP